MSCNLCGIIYWKTSTAWILLERQKSAPCRPVKDCQEPAIYFERAPFIETTNVTADLSLLEIKEWITFGVKFSAWKMKPAFTWTNAESEQCFLWSVYKKREVGRSWKFFYPSRSNVASLKITKSLENKVALFEAHPSSDGEKRKVVCIRKEEKLGWN